MKYQLFTYGTLQCHEVMLAVTGRSFPSVRAILPGYIRFTVEGQVFPGIIKRSSSQVEGLLYRDIDSKALERLDAFESDFYEHKKVSVELDDQSMTTALTYVVSPPFHSLLTDQLWDLDKFRMNHLNAYLARLS